MTQYPGPQWGGPPQWQQPMPPQYRLNVADIVFTVLLWLVVLVVAAAAGMWSFLYPMALDSCSPDCDSTPVDIGMGMVWIGIPVVALIGFSGTLWSLLRKKLSFPWPLGALVLTISLAIGSANLANSAMGN